jgi:hypothetical protein
MGKRLVGLLGALVMCVAGCTVEEATAPTFRVTSPTLATTSTTTPSTLEYLGLPDLNAPEIEMCGFIERVGQDLRASDEQSRDATLASEAASKSRTLSEPLRVRMLRDTEVANAQRFANVLKQFDTAIDLIASIEPGPLTSEVRLEEDARDAVILSGMGTALQETIDSVRPLDSRERVAYLERTGTEWRDLFTEEEFDDVLTVLHDSSSGMGRETEAREAMERLDDWSWRHCDAGLTR